MKRITKRLSVAGTRLLLLLLLMALLPNMASAQCPDNNHPHMIDLGLPSGTKWACCNVGATTPEGYGDYFAWGETQPKEVYNWDTYQYGYYNYDGDYSHLVDIGSDIAGTQYDAATANWGAPWRLPTLAQRQELRNNCTSEWTTQNGINGRTFTGPNGGTIFLPAAGCRYNSSIDYDGSSGLYWSSALNESSPVDAYILCYFDSGEVVWSNSGRISGQSVRPVAAPSSSGIPINETTFPDANFRNWVLSQTYGQDGVLTEAEIAGVTSIDVSSKNIVNLKGIEYFTALTKLWCGNNQLASLDVSHNTALEFLYCNDNQLTSLEVSKNTALTTLFCYDNQLTSLDVSHNTALTSLGCGVNPLTLLDVSHNTALKWLICFNNQLTSLDVSHNTSLTSLECYNNQLASLDVSQNTALQALRCYSNQLTTLDVSHNTALNELSCYSNRINEAEMGNLVESLRTVGSGYLRDFLVKNTDDNNEQNVITKAQVAVAKAKGWMVCNQSGVEYDGDEVTDGIPINETTFPDANFRNWVLSQTYGQDGVLTAAEIAGVTGAMRVESKNISNLKGIEYFTALEQLMCEGNQLTSLDISKNIALNWLECSNNQLTSLDISQNTALGYLDCCYNQLTSLDVSQNTALYHLICYSNRINETEMENLVQGLSIKDNGFFLFCVKNLADANEQNSITSTQVATAKAKGWYVCVWDGDHTYVEYNDVLINETTFPDVNFRNWVLSQTYGQDGWLTEAEIAGVTSIYVPSENIANLKGIEYFTALTSLGCGDNQLTSLDVSHNTALGYLDCSINQLTSLDVSKNTALEGLNCYGNQLTSLDVSHNTALTSLECSNNQLTSLDVSKNTALTWFTCQSNQLTSLDVSHNTALTYLYCFSNLINETEMGNLVGSLPTVGWGVFLVKNTDDNNEQNVITTAQVAAAKAKGWTVCNQNWVEYDGDEPTMNPIDNVDFGSEINGTTNLDGNVVGDIYYNISSGDGGYDVGEGCIVVTKPTDDAVVNGQDIFGEDFKDNYTGIVFKVPAGKGTIKVEAQTTGSMMIKVKIGDADPVTMELEGRLKVSFPYNVTEPTNVYIYGGSNSSAPGIMGTSSASGELKLYSVEVVQDGTGITSIDNGELTIDNYYTLDGRMLQGKPTQKGIYIYNGHKVVIK